MPAGMQAFRLNGTELFAHVSGALYWPEQRLLAVADLHLEKGSAFARRGELLPPYDTAATLAAVSRLADSLQPRQLLFLGDNFHDPDGPARLGESDRLALERLAKRSEVIWIEGNHDLGAIPSGMGSAAAERCIGSLVFRHEASRQRVKGEVSGHYHPKARIRVSTGSASARCFVFDRRRLILPAFGAYTGGLDVRHPEIQGLFPNGFKLVVLGKEKTVLLPQSALA